jgi:acyl-CoA thioester hydrolase
MNKFIYPLRVHIEDTDFAGVVYHSNYLNFMERARSEWLEEIGLGIIWQREHKIYFPVHSVYIEYIKPARLHEKVEVVSSIRELRRASIVFDQCLRLTDSPDKMLSKAEVRIACTDETMRPRAIPEVSDANFILRRIVS